MEVNIPVELESFVEDEFATGRYGSREEVLIQALQWLRDERQQALAGIRQGLADAAAGHVQPLAEAFTDFGAGRDRRGPNDLSRGLPPSTVGPSAGVGNGNGPRDARPQRTHGARPGQLGCHAKTRDFRTR